MGLFLDEEVVALNELIEDCLRSAELYEEASQHGERADPSLVAVAEQRRRLADELASRIAQDFDVLPRAVDPEALALQRLGHKLSASVEELTDRAEVLVEQRRALDESVIAKIDSRAPKGSPEMRKLLLELRDSCVEAARTS